MVRAGLGYLATADAARLPAATQAEALRELEQTDAMAAAARAFLLAAFTAGAGPRRGRGLQRGLLADPPHRDHPRRRRRPLGLGQADRHPPAGTGRAGGGKVSESAGRVICLWTDKLPQEYRDAGDEQLLAASAAGLGLGDLASLFAEMFVRARGDLPDQDPGREFADREVKLATTLGGAGVMHGDLTAECAAAVAAVLDALSAPAGKEDDRTKGQRYHDALQEAMRRLTAANLVPERAGQPVKAWVHITLADLLRLEGSSALQEQWTAGVRERWAARRAAASETGASDGAWLDGDAAAAITCDAAMAPIVTGDVERGRPGRSGPAVRGAGPAPPQRRGHGRRAGRAGRAGTDTTAAWAALEQAVIGKAVDLLSGPGGLASFLRRRQLGARLGGPSLPLDIGYAETIPAGIRNAVLLRDRHCQWAGGCTQPAGACEVHHTTHKATRRQDLGQGLRAAVPVPPPDRDSPVGLDPGRQPGRDDQRVEQEQDQGPAQPRTPGPAWVRAGVDSQGRAPDDAAREPRAAASSGAARAPGPRTGRPRRRGRVRGERGRRGGSRPGWRRRLPWCRAGRRCARRGRRCARRPGGGTSPAQPAGGGA